MTDTPLHAADPHHSTVVMASAGTGKTWLLVTRMIRLLLDGARPDALLAVTFTRKAAGEMEIRLLERLRVFAEYDAAALDGALAEIGAPLDAATHERAQRLYEELLYAPQPVRITTFHAFCQELLRRFPLEADVPAGFELVEAEGLLIQAAWDALFAEATAEPDGRLASALQTLFERSDGLRNTRKALLEFVAHRSDWWAYTAGCDQPLDAAIARLSTDFAVDPQESPAQFLAGNHSAFAEFAALLERHHTPTNAGHAALIHEALTHEKLTDAERCARLREALLTDGGTPRARKAGAAQAKSLGAAGQERFLQLHDTLSARLLELDERQKRAATLEVTGAWLSAGARLLDHYQRLKLERRQLDFADLEWKAYNLLVQAGNAHWVQYKLDQRIDHLLVDEFQDTNPVQWRLLLPLLEEIAAGSPERARSVFLVGDAKQSIYRFRRADARLLDHAAHWLQEQSAAQIVDLDKSRRSAPAILQCVNAVFSAGPLHERLAYFHTHDTHRQELWGRVELLPPPPESPKPAAAPALRDPLRTPRPDEAERAHDLEARQIAARIRALADAGIGYQDMLILLRRRTHAAAYERALRDAGIPYLGAARGALLESLEIRDLVALLNLLVVPFDDPALAQVLRAPLFAASDDDLMRLAQESGAWTDRLARLGAMLPADAPLARASRLLARWRELAERLPVHDLLDRIYSEGNVIARYEAAFPEALRPRLRANLARFIELALEVDSGRYPSLAHFLARVRELREAAQDAPDEAPPAAGSRVRLLTIHAAKGLEAQAVFLADCGPSRNQARAWSALIDWPAEAERPSCFQLIGPKASLDSLSLRRVAEQEAAERREEANLLYVALTRAQQLLIVSCAGEGKRQDDWYGQIKAALEPLATVTADGTLTLASGAAPAPVPPAAATAAASPAIDARLGRRLAPARDEIDLAPSRGAAEQPDDAGDEDGRLRGRIIHRLLETLCKEGAPEASPGLLRHVAREFDLHPDDAELQSCRQEAQAVIADPRLAELFDPAGMDAAWNEIPIRYRDGDRRVSGIIDRLVRRGNTALLIDYKTHRAATPERLAQLAEPYREQLRLYAQGVRALWPGVEVRALLLFTRCRETVELLE